MDTHPTHEQISNCDVSAIPPPPPLPPRDVNPFGEPEIPPAPDGRAREEQEPPAPRSPPPPVPFVTNGITFGSEADSSSSSSPPLGIPAVPEPATTFSSIRKPAPTPLVARRKALDETRLFEQQRSNYFGEKFEGDSLYWKCFVELIRRSQSNNRRAINFATQKLAAGRAYAKSLYAIRDNVDGFEPGTTEARCEKERKQKGPKMWPPVPSQDRQQQQQQQQQRQPDDHPGIITMTRPPSALDSLFVLEEHTAMRFLDVYEEAEVSVVQKRLRAMVKSLDDQFAEIVGQGTACLRLMHAAEANSAKAYSRYTAVVAESLKREEMAQGHRPLLMARDAFSSDVWLADMNYRVAVTQQGRVWKGVSLKLGGLFGKMKDIEVERRTAIQAGLAALVQLHDRLLRDLPVLKDPVLQSLDRINIDRQLLDQEVRSEMRKGAARLRATRHLEGGAAGCLGNTGEAGDGGGGDGGGGVGGSVTSGVVEEAGQGRGQYGGAPSAPDFIRNLPSPLESKLVLSFVVAPKNCMEAREDELEMTLNSALQSMYQARLTMLERREKTMLAGRWVLVLAILTHDAYLLLFDIPRGCTAFKKQLNARTSEAFTELVPKPEVDAMAVELGKQKDPKGLDASGIPVPPSVVIDLSACKAVFKPDTKSDANFEITEIKPARGVKGVFKDYEESKYLLRGRSQEAMVDWICQIGDMGRAGLQAVSAAKK